MEATVGTCGVVKDVSNDHEEGEEDISGSGFTKVIGGKVTEECMIGTLEHVVGDIDDLEFNDEDSDSAWTCFFMGSL